MNNAQKTFQRVSCILGVVLAVGIAACRDSEKTAIDDSSIATEVQKALSINSELAHNPITVEVRNGKVTLDGRVDRPEQRDTAEMLTRNVIGVEGVANRIVVAPAQAESDLNAKDMKATAPEDRAPGTEDRSTQQY